MLLVLQIKGMYSYNCAMGMITHLKHGHPAAPYNVLKMMLMKIAVVNVKPNEHIHVYATRMDSLVSVPIQVWTLNIIHVSQLHSGPLLSIDD